VVKFVKTMAHPEAIELGVGLGESGQPNRVYGKVSARGDPQNTGTGLNLEELCGEADRGLEAIASELWICIDRLDVAFEENVSLERNALRALFKTYLDLRSYAHVRFKIFLRSDIWKRLTAEGFREASHIVTRALTISWDSESLLNLVIRRLLQSDDLTRNYLEDRQTVLGSLEAQRRLFYRVFPRQIDVGKKKPTPGTGC
jgi:hypothetical protein